MQLKKASRKAVRLKIGVAGPSGSGKTYSSLLMAYGITQDWTKIAVIDTENGSASLYSHLGDYNTIEIASPFSPEKYIEAIKVCEKAGMHLVIIDSISQEWSGKGGCLDIHEQETQKQKVQNSFTAWASVTPRHQAFIDAILQSPCHVITSVRSKTEYIMGERNGKQVPQKVGMQAVTRDGFEYELSLSFDIDTSNKASASKDRTGLFFGKPSFVITESTGKSLIEWANKGEDPLMTSDQRKTIDGLIEQVELSEKQQKQIEGGLNAYTEAQAARCIEFLESKLPKASTNPIPDA